MKHAQAIFDEQGRRVKCRRHPKYKAVRSPSCVCWGCWGVWADRDYSSVGTFPFLNPGAGRV